MAMNAEPGQKHPNVLVFIARVSDIRLVLAAPHGELIKPVSH